MENNLVQEIWIELHELSMNPANVKDYSRFHKDGKKHISLASTITRKFYAEKFKQVKHLDKKQILDLCEKLLEYKDDSCRGMAFDWAFRIRKKYTIEDFVIFEKWLDKYIDTWGSCDDFCTHALGYFLWRFPGFIPEIYKLTKSESKWKRRASAVIFIYAARKDKYLEEIIKTAISLLQDKEDLVQKGYGWMLKEASIIHQKEIFHFVMKNKRAMPRIALRYAIEKMPLSLKAQAMKKRLT